MTTDATPRSGRRGTGFWMGVGSGLAIIALLGYVFLSSFGNDSRQPDSVLIGKQISSMELPLLDGSGVLAFDDLRGEVLVVNFFASWCRPACINEHPHLVSVSDAYADRGVQFVGVVYQDTDEAALGFLDRLGRGDDYLYVQDPGSRAIVEFGVFGVPETYFVDASGTIVHKVYGEVNATILTDALDAILAGESPS